MKIIFDRIIAKLEDISDRDDYGKIVDLDEAIDVVYEVKNDYIDKFVSVSCLEQFKWERDIALQQIEKLGLGLGQIVDGKYLSKEEYEELLEYKNMYKNLCR